MNEDSKILKKSKRFAIRIVKLYKFLKDKNEYVMSKQILRSGTGIGANLSEGKYAQSSADFLTKLNIALKEAAETEYWLELLYETDYLTNEQFESINADCREINKMLISAVRSLKDKNTTGDTF